MELEDAGLEAGFIKDDRSETIEVSLRQIAKRLSGYKFLMNFLAPSINPLNYLTGVKLSLGKHAKILGAGYRTKKKSPQIIKSEHPPKPTLQHHFQALKYAYTHPQQRHNYSFAVHIFLSTGLRNRSPKRGGRQAGETP